MNEEERDAATERVREFYDGPADTLYKMTWGENLHLGIPRAPDDSRQSAMAHATERMMSAIELTESSKVLDLGSGYGGPARQLAAACSCHVTGLNLSAVEISAAEQQTRASGLADRVGFVRGDFHALDFSAASFDVVWSQDSFMYGADKQRILAEAYRVLIPGGVLTFTDILVRRKLAPALRQRLYERVRTPEMWDSTRYLQGLLELGFSLHRMEDWSRYVEASYAAALSETLQRREELSEKLGEPMISRTLDGLAFWVEMAKRGDIGWAFFVAKKPLIECKREELREDSGR